MSLTIAEGRASAGLRPYVQIARIDHWFKNAFMLLGVVLAVFYQPDVAVWSSLVPLAIAVLATCLVASSNYVLNELLDAPSDRLHPEKKHRPVPSGQVRFSRYHSCRAKSSQKVFSKRPSSPVVRK